MNNLKVWFPNISAALFAGLVLTSAGYADESPHDAAKVIVTGVLKESMCSFGDKNITVEFGDVFIGQINSGNYSKTIDYALKCGDDRPDGVTFTMQIDGTPAGFDSHLLKTDVPGLAIKLLHDNTPFSPGERFAINEVSPPELKAVLVQDPTAKLTEGQEFNGIATLKVEWQ